MRVYSKKIFAVIALTLILMLGAALAIPYHFNPSAEQAIPNEFLICGAVLKSQVTEALLKRKPIPSGLKRACDWASFELEISQQGVINLKQQEYNLVLEYKPQEIGSEIIWSCSGSSHAFVPQECHHGL